MHDNMITAHLHATAISDHLKRLYGREVVRQPEIDVVPVHKPVVSPAGQKGEKTDQNSKLTSCSHTHFPLHLTCPSDEEKKGTLHKHTRLVKALASRTTASS